MAGSNRSSYGYRYRFQYDKSLTLPFSHNMSWIILALVPALAVPAPHLIHIVMDGKNKTGVCASIAQITPQYQHSHLD